MFTENDSFDQEIFHWYIKVTSSNLFSSFPDLHVSLFCANLCRFFVAQDSGSSSSGCGNHTNLCQEHSAGAAFRKKTQSLTLSRLFGVDIYLPTIYIYLKNKIPVRSVRNSPWVNEPNSWKVGCLSFLRVDPNWVPVFHTPNWQPLDSYFLLIQGDLSGDPLKAWNMYFQLPAVRCFRPLPW